MPLSDFMDEPTGDKFMDVPKSGLSQFMDEPVAPEPTAVAPAPEVKLPQTEPEKFYGKTAVSAPFQGLIPMIMTPELSAYMGRKGMGPKPEGGWDEMGQPLNKEGKPYADTPTADPIRNAAADTISGLASMATHPLEVVRGGIDFFMSIPGFMVGMLGAMKSIADRTVNALAYPTVETDPKSPDFGVHIFGDLTLNDLYDEASKGMQEGMQLFEPAKRLIAGEPTPESDLATRVAMAPLSTFSMLGQQVANWKGFKNHPNIQGAAKFAGDISGLIAMGLLFHGASAKQDFARKVEEVVTDSTKIIEKEQAIQNIPDELVKQTQQKVLEMEKVQVELKAKSIADGLKGEVQIREEMGRQYEELEKAKIYPVEDTGLKTATKGELAKVFRKTPEELADPEATFTSKKGNEYVKVEGKWYTKDGVEVSNKFVIGAAERGVEVKAEEPAAPAPTGSIVKLRKKPKAEPAPVVEEPTVKEPNWEDENVKSELAKVKVIEDYFGRRISEISDEEIESFFTEDKIVEEPLNEVDLQTGTEKPIQLQGEQSPFFQNKVKTAAARKLWAEKGDKINDSPEMLTQKLINDVNRWYHGDKNVDIAKVREQLSAFAYNADDLLTLLNNNGEAYFIRGEDHLKWKETVSEAADWARGLDNLKFKTTDEGTKLYSGIPLDEVKETIIKGADDFMKYVKEASALKSFKPAAAAKMLREEFNRSFVDRSGNIRKDFLDKLGEDGYKILQKMYLSKGASSLSANMLKQMRKEVYGGLSRNERRILDGLILGARMEDIAKYKAKYNYPKNISSNGKVPDKATYYLNVFAQREKLSPEKAHELYHVKEDGTIGGRVRMYFDWMKKPLNDMLEAGLIKQEEYDNLVKHSYRRTKLVDIFDKRYGAKIGGTKRTVYDSGIESLAKGRTTDIYEPSSEVMALEVFNRAYGRVLNNKANQELLNLAQSQKDNPFVRVKEKGGELIPSGWSRLFVYDKGERKSIWISPELSKEWITRSPETSYKYSQLLRYASGSPVLRTFATGINWGFALANLPKDVMHAWFAARKFEDGQWKPIYSSNLPIYGLQMGRDLGTTFSDALLRKGRYEDYIKEGGGMEFLVHQGRLLQRGKHLEGNIDKIYNFMGYLGETTEVMTRLAIRERMLRQGKSAQEATFAARDYMDFGQGGGIAKALDNAFPYLNASIQGTRGMFRSIKDNKVASAWKLTQLATLTTGLYIAMQKQTPQTAKALKNDIQMQNNLCIPLGDDFGFEDENGQTRYPYLKIPLDPGQRFFKKFFEASTDKWLGNEVDVEGTINALENISPAGVSSLPPTASGALGYAFNKDFWLNEDIWKKTDKPFSWPQSKEEYIPGRTPQAYIDLGAKTGLSPERTKYAVEELVTGGTLWSYLLGQGYDVAFGDLPKSNKEMHLAEVLAKTPVVKRFFGITNPYSEFGQKIDQAKEDSDLKRWIQNRGLDARVEGYLVHKNVKRDEVIDYIRKTSPDKDTYDRLRDRFDFQVKTKDLTHKSFWLRLRGLSTEARAKVYVDRLTTSTDSEKDELRNEFSIVRRAGGIDTPEFRKEVMRLRSE